MNAQSRSREALLRRTFFSLFGVVAAIATVAIGAAIAQAQALDRNALPIPG